MNWDYFYKYRYLITVFTEFSVFYWRQAISVLTKFVLFSCRQEWNI
jgi:hypothetical protein